MKNNKNHISSILLISWLVATSTVKRSKLSLKLVTILILTLTFLNLTVVGGILRGITQDVGKKVQENLVGDVYIEPNKDYSFIQHTPELITWLDNHSDLISSYSPRLLHLFTIESEYLHLHNNEEPLKVNVSVIGIDTTQENATTNLEDKMVTGRFLLDNEVNKIVLGSSLVDGYSSGTTGDQDTLGKIEIGDMIKLKGIYDYEFEVVGILKTKASLADQRSYITKRDFQRITGSTGHDYKEIAINLQSEYSSDDLKLVLNQEGLSEGNNIKTANEALPSAVSDLQRAFLLIENIVGLISILVSLVTVFVIVFINALSRRRQLGILKAQGIEPLALIFSYILQALFYAILAVFLGSLILVGPVREFFLIRPISLPMADGSLSITLEYVTVRALLLLVSAIFSGMIPAWLVVKQNTLDSILGR